MRVDTTKIAGYAEMTAEQKLAALEALEFAPGEGYVAKALLDKATSEAAGYKKQLREKLSEDEQKAAEAKEAHEKLQADYDKLLKETTISRYKAELLGQGYPEKLASEMADAMHAGDTSTVFAKMREFQTEHDKQVKADAMKGMTPPAGGSTGGDDGAESDAVKMAKAIGQAASGNAKAANEAMNAYIIK